MIKKSDKYEQNNIFNDNSAFGRICNSRYRKCVPQDEAGISAYVNIGECLNLHDASGAFYQLLDSSDTHAVGTIRLDNLHSADYIHVYIDTNGWIVPYLERGESTGMLVQWLDIDATNPEIKITFEEAIELVCDEIGINYTAIEGNISFYDFQHPDAKGLSILLNTQEYDGYESAHVHLPTTSTIYKAGYSLVNTVWGPWNGYYYGASGLYLDELPLEYTSTKNKRILGEYDIVNKFTVGETHSIQLKKSMSYGRKGLSGMASVLVYS